MALRLFEGFGVELEHMIVDRATLDVRPISDEVLREGAGTTGVASDVEIPETGIGWSNELVLHVLEHKTVAPVPTLAGLAAKFDDSVARVNALLAAKGRGAKLMPSAMHPWMDPMREMRLWPHDNGPIYAAFDRIFGCTGHGWANLQSVHLNLPFSGDREFGRLHAAIRLVLPLLPAIAASSPIMDGKPTGVADNRLAVYRTNARRVPSVAGRVIPEPVYTRGHYEVQILDRIYRDLAPHDPEGILREEWANSRGAIARFVRDSIEIRVMDVQECPLADVAICAAVVSVLMDLVDERWGSLKSQQAWPIDRLEPLLVATMHLAEWAVIEDTQYLRAFGYRGNRCTAQELWRHLAETSVRERRLAPECRRALDTIVDRGTLSTRISRAIGINPDRGTLMSVYGRLCECLAEGRQFV